MTFKLLFLPAEIRLLFANKFILQIPRVKQVKVQLLRWKQQELKPLHGAPSPQKAFEPHQLNQKLGRTFTDH